MNKARIVSVISIFTFLFITSAVANAQLRLPRPSQGASVTQTIGVTDITINYSRPAVKDRTIFADAPATMASRAKGEATLDNQDERVKGEPIVPWGHVWRTGANEATRFFVTDDVMINGQKLPAGKYSLSTIPGKDEWTVIFNSDYGQWGSFAYDEKKDVLRVKTKPQWVSDNQELLSYSFEPTADNATAVVIRWEKVRVPFTIQVDVAGTTLAKARKAVAEAKSDDWRTPFQAAGYAKQNNDMTDAGAWIDSALKAVDNSIAAKPSFQNLS